MTTSPRPVPGHSRNLTETMRMNFHSLMEGINTSIPGIVETFDAATRRARVRPAVQVEVGGAYRDHVYLLDVPVITPFGAEYGLTVDVQVGSVVQLIFSQRGIGLFKEAFANGPPSVVGFFSLQDAVAIAGVGPLEMTPALPSGVAIQHADGGRYVGIDGHGVHIVSGNTVISIDAGSGNVTIGGGSIAIGGGSGNVTIRGGRIAIGGDVRVEGVVRAHQFVNIVAVPPVILASRPLAAAAGISQPALQI